MLGQWGQGGSLLPLSPHSYDQSAGLGQKKHFREPARPVPKSNHVGGFLNQSQELGRSLLPAQRQHFQVEKRSSFTPNLYF